MSCRRRPTQKGICPHGPNYPSNVQWGSENGSWRLIYMFDCYVRLQEILCKDYLHAGTLTYWDLIDDLDKLHNKYKQQKTLKNEYIECCYV